MPVKVVWFLALSTTQVFTSGGNLDSSGAPLKRYPQEVITSIVPPSTINAANLRYEDGGLAGSIMC
jgi:hypothetical protein